MIVERLPGGPWKQNAYLVVNGEAALLFDPGGSASCALSVLAERRLKLAAILNTHGHFDHIGAVQELMDATGAAFFISGREVPIMKSSNMLRFIFKIKEKVTIPTVFTDLDLLPERMTLAGLEVSCLKTPGHTPGGYCFLIDGHLFSGDTLLPSSPGTSELPGGDRTALLQSIKQLHGFPQDLLLHAGHGRDTTLGEALSALSGLAAKEGEV